MQYLGTVECDRSEKSRWIGQNHFAAQLERHLPPSSHHNGSFQGLTNSQATMPQMLRTGMFPSFAQRRSASKMPRPGPITTYPLFAYQMSEPSTPYTSMSSSCSPQAWSFNSSPGVIGQERELMREGGPLLSTATYGSRGDRRGSALASDFGGQHHNVVNTERIRRGLDVRTTVCIVLSSSDVV